MLRGWPPAGPRWTWCSIWLRAHSAVTHEASLDQALANLVINARDAITGQGKITIVTRANTRLLARPERTSKARPRKVAKRMLRLGSVNFDVYLCTNTAVVTLVREVSFRTAHIIARHHADTRHQPVFIRNCATKAVETVGPRAD